MNVFNTIIIYSAAIKREDNNIYARGLDVYFPMNILRFTNLYFIFLFPLKRIKEQCPSLHGIRGRFIKKYNRV